MEYTAFFVIEMLGTYALYMQVALVWSLMAVDIETKVLNRNTQKPPFMNIPSVSASLVGYGYSLDLALNYES